MPHATYPQSGTNIPTVNGPSSDRLVDAYKYSYDKRDPHTVDFTDRDGNVYTVKVTGVAHEDASGQSHMFRGYLVHFLFNGPDGLFDHRIDNVHVRGYWYAGSPRRGWIEFHSNPIPLQF